ncbi:excisionase family DNA-binding protein [Amycolatopsis sp., V23-08]|uniref:Excisionase family DNA-binding protein n=1 Tax=Amycolatopsis heterodermiae TaxID=3110235 RepID=A0ABU5R3H4_9PSEU|nr:excisionase family DNA-binding protein [Amycolatopsis sp., V23-08]MEA5360250.1 excisionase family DNA-binding protein [Amycolatopsis sp., V23-08]
MSESDVSVPRFLTVGQAVKLLGVSAMTIYRAVDEGGFPAVRTRGRISIPAKAIDAMEEVAVSEMRAVDSSEFTLPKRNSVDIGGR